MKKVLIISQIFPPAGGPGVQRTTKFVRYLPEMGWLPIVWSGLPPSDLPMDESLTHEIPDIARCYTFGHGDSGQWKIKTEHACKAITRRLAINHAIGESLAWRLGYCVENIRKYLVPDPGMLWAMASILPLLAKMKKEKPQAIYSTYSPASNHLLAQFIHRFTGIPWVADFRDLWTEEGRYIFAKGPRWRRKLEQYMEQKILEQADAIIGVTPSQTGILARRVPGQKAKFFTITNGYDNCDFPKPTEIPNSPETRFTISHVGRLTEGRVTPELVQAINRVSDDLAKDSVKLSVRWVGQMPDAVRTLLNTCRADQHFINYIDHHAAVREMASTDILLLLMQDMHNGNTILAGKTFEYLASGKPILQVGQNNGEASRLVRQMNAGITAPANERDIREGIMKIYQARRNGQQPYEYRGSELLRFHRRTLTRNLAAIMNSIAGCTPHHKTYQQLDWEENEIQQNRIADTNTTASSRQRQTELEEICK